VLCSLVWYKMFVRKSVMRLSSFIYTRALFAHKFPIDSVIKSFTDKWISSVKENANRLKETHHYIISVL